MKIIISPAKKMKIIDDVVIQCTTPLFLLKTTKLLHHLQSLDYEELKSYLKCSDTIAKTTFEQFQNMSLDKYYTPAILSYSGIQYQYMAPHVFTDDQMKYIQEHLYILSGFYGLLRPLDAITPYRLEMQTKCPFSLYDFWKEDLAKQIDEPILNLASEEYAKIIRKYKPLVDVRFIEENGKEPSPSHLKNLIDTCKKEKVRVIFVQPEFDRRNAEIIAKQTGTKVIPISLKMRLKTLKILLALMSLIMFLMRVKVQKNCTYFKKSYRHDSFSNNSTTICVCSLYVVYALSSLFSFLIDCVTMKARSSA